MEPTQQIRALINRLARLDAAETWGGDLNPAQRTALEYLASANQYSRAPSHVADFLGTTRGTASQTLKALARKGYLSEAPRTGDKRSISYRVTEDGQKVLGGQSVLQTALGQMTGDAQAVLVDGLGAVLRGATRLNNAKPFGICRTCRHFATRPEGGHCALLNVALAPQETEQLCHEQQPA